MKIYLCWGQPEDQVIALRVQALGAVCGITSFVPGVKPRIIEIPGRIAESYCMFAITTTKFSTDALREIAAAYDERIPVWPILPGCKDIVPAWFSPQISDLHKIAKGLVNLSVKT